MAQLALDANLLLDMPTCRTVTSRVCSSALLVTEPARYALLVVDAIRYCAAAARCAHLQEQQELEGSKFKKLCSDCGLVDKKFTVTDVDLMFAKVDRDPALSCCFVVLSLVSCLLLGSVKDKGLTKDDLC